MLVEKLPFPEKVISVLKESVAELNEPQVKAIKAGLLDGKNLVVASLTASGKTLIAELAILKKFLNNGKSIYLVPLKALASEKYNEFREKYSKLGMRISISIGDLDGSDDWLANYDLVIASNEKMDSLLRHGAEWVKNISLVVADEIHLLNDAGRGPTLEVVLTRLRRFNPQVLALSATIKNAEEIAEWLDASLVKSDYRPVKLCKGVFYPNHIDAKQNDAEHIDAKGVRQSASSSSGVKHVLEMEGKRITLNGNDDSEVIISSDTVKKEKQALIFLSARRSAEAAAERIAGKIKVNNDALKKVSKEIETALPHPTKQCKRLAKVIEGGVAFHHAGLVAKQRKIIEDNFRNGIIKIITATPTLCLDSSVKVWSGMTNTNIANIKHGKLWALAKNKLMETPAKNITEMEAPWQMVKITSTSGDEIILTPNHRVLVKRKGEKALIAASECRTENKIAMAGRINMETTKAPKWSDFVIKNKLPIEDRALDEDVFYFIGAMLGDGYSGAENRDGRFFYKGSPCIVGRDTEVFDRIRLFCHKYSIDYRECKNFYGVPQIVFSKAKWFREFLVRCGVDIGQKKHINEKLLCSHKRPLSQLLRGLFDTDGCVEKRTKRVSFSNTSFDLIDDVRRSLLGFGIVTSFRKRGGCSMKFLKKTYSTKDSAELYIQHRKCLYEFYKEIDFGVERKSMSLEEILKGFMLLVNKISCNKCSYEIFLDTFEGRTKEQKEWGRQKMEIIELLGKYGKMKSWQIKEKTGLIPWKGEKRLNHHFNLIARKRIGNNAEWELNTIGRWVFENLHLKNLRLKDYFQKCTTCPLCGFSLQKKLRGTWKTGDFEEDIYWDKIKSTEFVMPTTKKVYDMILPDGDGNDHMFVANGFIVHNSFGMNLPAWRVIIRDAKRYSGFGLQFLPVLEVHQMMGRAGRPKYDSEGEAIIIAKTESEAGDLKERYIDGEPEPIYSKLSVEPVLRMHVLALVASGIEKKSRLEEFFSETFFAHQYSDMEEVNRKIEKILKQLESFGFIEIKHGSSFISKDFVPAFSLEDDIKITATPIGKRVSELYLDPESAHKIIQGMKKPNDTLGYLTLINSCTEMWPLLRVKQKEYELVEEELIKSGISIDTWDVDYDEFMMSFKTALVFNDWADEWGEDRLLDKYDIAPGELYSKITNADWMLYAASELAKLLDKKDTANELNKLRLCIKHGVKEELLELVRIRNIGRVRARLLWKNNIKSVRDVRNASEERLGKIIGTATAKQLKQELQESLDKKMRAVKFSGE